MPAPDRAAIQDQLDAAQGGFRAGRIRSLALIHSCPDGGIAIGLHMACGSDRAKWVEAVRQLLDQVQHGDYA